jgi:hypothetical protein
MVNSPSPSPKETSGSSEIIDQFKVLQTTIHYNTDHIGGVQTTEIEGTYATRAAARAAARTALLGPDITKESFAEYNEMDDERDLNEWPYGEETLVHAVMETGENFNVAVKAQPHSHQQHHARKHHEKKHSKDEGKERGNDEGKVHGKAEVQV